MSASGGLQDNVGPEAADPECPLFRRHGRKSRRDAGTAKLAFLTPMYGPAVRSKKISTSWR